MDSQQLEHLIIASLLHDIGKFAQRAEAPKSREMEGEYCPVMNRRPTHTHVLYTDYFIEHVLPLPKELDEGKIRSQLARLASAHHKPDSGNLLESVLCVADRLSAGTDRKKGEESDGDYKTARLVSIFEQLSFSGARLLDELQSGKHHCLAPLTEAPFPVSAKEAQQTDYASLYGKFCEGLKQLPLDMGTKHYIDSLASLLEEYTWCIPSATYKALSDISLFDHATTTAAIAQALAVYHHERNEGYRKTPDDPKFLLFGGDISGIQRYIFGLDKSHGSGIAKLFRARSFFIQALTRSVVLVLLKRLGLNPIARIMDAGGRFILLLPATDRVRALLPDFELEVQRYFFERFRGELSLNLCWSTELTEEDFEQTVFQSHLDGFHDALERRKLKKFDRLIEAGTSPILDLDYSLYKNGDCPVCHMRPVDGGQNRDGVKLCRECSEQIEQIGSRLPRCHYLVFEQGAGGSVPVFGGITLSLKEEVDPGHRTALEIVAIHQRGRFAYQPIATHLPVIRDEDIRLWRHWGEVTPGQNGEQQIDGERVAAGDPKTFNLLALSARETTPEGSPIGRSFLGAFKADVDNLGMIFSIGLQDRISISRFASLSRMINHFFSDYLVRWIKAEYPDLYLVFAGGDDLFLIGPWRQVVRFSEALNPLFRKFVADRPEITLSAGIGVTKPGLPMHGIAAQAEEQLEHSKQRPGKNAITLFATTTPWEDFGRLIAKGDWLHAMMQGGRIPKGLCGRLLYYGRERKLFNAGDIPRGIYLSHMKYDFARNITEKSIPDAGTRNSVTAIQQDEFLLDHINLPATWALYRLRKDS